MMKGMYRRRVIGIAAVLTLMVLFSTGSDVSALSFFKKSTFDEAVSAWDKKEYERSFSLSQKALAEEPQSAAARKLLGWNYIKLGRASDAEPLFLEAKQAKHDDIGAIQGLAWVYGEQGRNNEAEQAFRQEIKWAKEHMDSDYWMDLSGDDQTYIRSIYSDGNYGLAQLAYRTGKYEQAGDYLTVSLKFRNQFTAEGERFLLLGDIYAAAGNPGKAVSAYEEALKAEPKNLPARLKMAWNLYSAKQYASAGAAFEKAIELNRNIAEGFYGLALCRYQEGKLEQARTNLQQAIKIYPYYADNLYVHHDLIGKRSEWQALWKDFGLAYYRWGDYAAALYKLDGYLGKVKADDYDALIAAGWSYRWSGNPDKARASFDAAAKLRPQADEPHVGLGSAWLAYGNRNAESRAAFDRALALNPRSAPAYNGLAYLYNHQKEDKKTEEALKKSLTLNKDDMDSQLFLANLLFRQKRYDEALREYEKAIQINKYSTVAWNNAGWSHYYGGRLDQAIKAFGESKRINPYFVEPYYALGLIYAKKGDLVMAKGQFRTAIDISPYYSHSNELVKLINANPGWGDLRTALGWSYYNHRQYGPALAAFKEQLAVKPGDPETKRGIAWSSYRVNLKDAEAAFRDILKDKADDPDALVGMGWVLFYQNRDKESLDYLQRAVNKDPKLTNAWRTIAAIHFRNRNLQEAEAIYKKVAVMEPKALDIHNNQGWALYKEHKYKEAADKFNDSIRLNRYYGEPHYGLALCYAKTGTLEKAKTSFTTAIYLYPAYMDGQEFYTLIDGQAALKGLYNDLGWSYYYKYDFAAAKYHFNRMLKLDPKNQEAARGLEAIAKVLGAKT